MVTTVNAEIFTFDGDEVWPVEKQRQFFEEHGRNAIIELVSENGLKHLTYESMVGDAEVTDIRIPVSADMFKDAFFRTDKEMTWIVCDEDGNYLTVLKAVPSYYLHMYGQGEPDLSFLNKYDAIVFYGLNEFAVELYRKALPLWTGKRVVLCGEWEIMGNVLPGLRGKEIILQSNWSPSDQGVLLDGVSDNVLHVGDRMPKNEDISRLTSERIVLLEEVMTYTFCFNNLRHFGEKYPDKKFFVIDGHFSIEGIFGIQDKVFNMARFAKSRGYEPVFYIINSTDNMYSDFEGDDIWGKFMNQPGGASMDMVKEAKNVYISPNANCLTIMRHIFRENTPADTELDWSQGLYNEKVEKYIANHGKIMTDSSNTLGVLVRGTDYQKTKFPGHPVHATVEQVIEKITEVEKEHPYKYIYLATEDAEILEEMKRAYGDRLIYTDQERFTIEPGKLLASLHGADTKEMGKGFRLGAEYLCTLRLLSQCESLIASGACGGVEEAIRENGGKYRFIYVFKLGINERK